MFLKFKPYKGKHHWYFKTKRSKRFRRLTRLDPDRYAHIYQYCKDEQEHNCTMFRGPESKPYMVDYKCEVKGLFLNPNKPRPQYLSDFLGNIEISGERYLEYFYEGRRKFGSEIYQGLDFSYQETNSNPSTRITFD